MPQNLLIIEIGSQYFLPSGHMPCIDQYGKLVRALADAIGLAPAQAPNELVLFGYADIDGSSERSYDLSWRRGAAIRSLLLYDRKSWELAARSATANELSYSLAGISEAMKWNCNTNQRGHLIEGAPSDALRIFQAECSKRYDLDIPDDGLPSIACWSGIYLVIVELVRNCLRREYAASCNNDSMGWQVPKLGYPEGLGIFPGSSSFGLRGRGKQDAIRRVDMVFMSPDVRLHGLARRKPPCNQNNVWPYDGHNIRDSTAEGRDQGRLTT